MTARGARWTGLILAMVLGQFLYLRARSAWTNHWLNYPGLRQPWAMFGRPVGPKGAERLGGKGAEVGRIWADGRWRFWLAMVKPDDLERLHLDRLFPVLTMQ